MRMCLLHHCPLQQDLTLLLLVAACTLTQLHLQAMTIHEDWGGATTPSISEKDFATAATAVSHLDLCVAAAICPLCPDNWRIDIADMMAVCEAMI